MSNILSIQSAVAYGHVGNSAAVFPLQRIGHEVWPVYTVNYSNHTGYGAWKGPIIPAAEVAEVIEGIRERGAFELIDAILTGYQASPDIADVIVDAVTGIKAENPNATYACDPVMGSAKSGCFVPDAVPPMFREKVVPVADVITPNQFELGYLVEQDVTDLDSTLAAVDAAREMGPDVVLVTSLTRPDALSADAAADGGPGVVEMLAVDDTGAWLVRTPRLPFKRNGSGDVTAALFTGHIVHGASARDALSRTASAVYDMLRITHEADAPELKLVEAQDFYANPAEQFIVEKL
ncbi:pyridoxal kinase [Corynebacterium sp. BCW_4722]|nr:pyridoxal kinase [Corynebacterium sp. BCW_4722]